MSKEHAHAYEAGYRDGSINYELEHCPACKNVADLQEALAENARLRSELDSVGTAAYLYGRSDLKAENAKLKTKMCYDTGENRIFHCSECDLGLDDVYIDDEERYSFADFPRFCPFCGAEVV